uniref:AC transposase n=1 Tax=Cajanus cajan TaxID=3821 RepID=A0A151R5Y5_CAJCA|nr:Putative AC transposase [Cajanus cajan]
MAECNHCGKRYRCDPKIHGTSSLLNHIGKCPKYPNAIINDPNQTSLTLKRDVSGLTVVSQRYNVEACRRALIVFIILDEFHMRCCAHILNLVMNDGLKDVHNSIASIRTTIRFVRSSTQRLAKFKECVEFSKIECKKLLCLDVPTRCNSTYMMLYAAEKFQVSFEKLDFEDSRYVEVFAIAGPPTTVDWENVRAYF